MQKPLAFSSWVIFDSQVFDLMIVYLSELLRLYTPSRDLRFSADTRILKIPRSNSKAFGQRSFSHIGPSTWNGLPYTLRHSDSQTSFRQALKAHLFQQSF